jgi:hypothetical protein
LSSSTGGKFYPLGQINAMLSELQNKKVSSVIRSEESFDSALNLKWVFGVLLLLISAEWFLRKYFGSY